ncbi:MAG: porin family protein [Hyphomicrobiaceae bacterium]|nr:porin family protein [Hyphomicrobiaceae bacterium]
MSNIRGSIALSIAVLALSGISAGAADLYGGSAKDGYVPAYAAPSAPSSWYVRIDGSYSHYDDPIMVEDHIYDLVDTGIGNTWAIGGGVGRYLGNGFRMDVTYEHRFEADATGFLDNHYADLNGTREFGLKSNLLLANLYYDFNQGGRFSPYLGVGLGYVRHETTPGVVVGDCGCDGTIEGEKKGSVAAALMAGFSVNLTAGRSEMVSGGSTKDGPVYVTSNRGLLLDIGYRYLYLGDATTGVVRGFGNTVVSEDPVVENIHAHELRMGLRYNLN